MFPARLFPDSYFPGHYFCRDFRRRSTFPGLWRSLWWTAGDGSPPPRGRVFRRADPGRVFRWHGQPTGVALADFPRTRLRKLSAERVSLLFDFSDTPEVRGGAVLANPTVTAAPAGLTLGAPAVTVFPRDGVGAGLAVEVAVEGGAVDAEYTLDCSAQAGGATRLVSGLLSTAPAFKVPLTRLRKRTSERVSLVFDFSAFPEVRDGEALSAPAVTVSPAGLSATGAAVTPVSRDGVPAGRGVAAWFEVGGVVGGEHRVECVATTSGGWRRAVDGVVFCD